VNIIKKFPWYIWFSVFAFMSLVVATMFQTRASSKRKLPNNIWGLQMRNFWYIVFKYMMLPMLVTVIILNVLSRFIPLGGIADSLPDVAFYTCGVICAYKHDLWRRKHGLHLPAEGPTEG